ncbi:MAG: hypothetical protein NDI90_20620 [Nitrospira sp. BO4]|jgi:hypothetical protein|nr:hypothetical protein [Nitrospira sp. BO4]
MKQTLDNLCQFLEKIPKGSIDTEELSPILSECWDDLCKEKDYGMQSQKLDRMENVLWDPPKLSFVIERHGGTVKGSAYAEVQTWTIDVDRRTASCVPDGKRFIGKRQLKLDVQSVAKEIAMLIEQGRDDSRLKWLSNSRVKVLVGKVISADGPQQTVHSRRKRFRTTLVAQLRERGWHPESNHPHTYVKEA